MIVKFLSICHVAFQRLFPHILVFEKVYLKNKLYTWKLPGTLRV